MYIRTITLRFCESMGGFPEDALRKATFGRAIIEKKEYFFTVGGVPHITYSLLLDGEGDPSGRFVSGRGGNEAIQAKADELEKVRSLNPRQLSVFKALKSWRNAKGEEQGVPKYVIARNVQLLDLIRAAPKSLAAIREVDGCGEAFCEKYGTEILTLLAELPTPAEIAVAESEKKQIE